MKNKSSILPISIITILIVAGCATTSSMSSGTAQNFTPGQKYGENEGYLVGSFSINSVDPRYSKEEIISNYNYSSYLIKYSQMFDDDSEQSPLMGTIGAKESEAMKFLGPFNPVMEKTRVFKEDFVENEKEVFLFAIPLKQGKYRFYQYHFFHTDIFGYQSFFFKPNEEAVFEIRKGKATYIGELKSVHLFGKGALGNIQPRGGYYQCLDMIDRDKYKLISKYPFLSNVDFIIEPIKALESYDPQEKSSQSSYHQTFN